MVMSFSKPVLKLSIILIILIICQSVQSQNYTISGYVEDINSGERIIGAYVTDSISKSVAQTNNYGFYMLKNIRSSASIQATYIGLKSKTTNLSLVKDTMMNLLLKPVLELKEVVVSSSRYNRNINAPVSYTHLTLPTILRV